MERNSSEKYGSIGKYALLERLGQGGMGEVWKARDTRLQRYVALKLLRTDLQNDPDFVAYFMREARLVAALRHPNIVQIHDFQASTGNSAQAYMVMDYIEGGTLADAIRRMTRQHLFWSAHEIVGLFTGLSLALDYAHAQGMIHRDIKPANILLDQTLATGQVPGVPVLTDFGIARWQSGDATVKGFVGTPLYISPEQAQNRPLDTRSDLYSLGIILYEVLTGVTPFRGDNPLGVMLQHVEEPPPLPASLNPLVSPALSAVVLRSIAKKPQERFSSATEMTISLARAFAIPVPVALDSSRELSQLSSINPLQPLAGLTPIPPTSPAFFVPPSHLSLAASENERVKSTPAEAETLRLTPATSPALSAQPLPATSLPELSGARTKKQNRPGRRRKALLAIGLVALLLVLLGTGALIVRPHLFSASSTLTPTVSTVTVGNILFLSSSPALQGTLNEVQIKLTTVPPAPPGLAYYAWLTRTNNEALIPHWQLPAPLNGVIQDVYTSTSPASNLLTGSDRFLVTLEDNTMMPDVPTFVLTRHLYYALITHTTTASPSFAVKSCPSGNLSNASNPCR